MLFRDEFSKKVCINKGFYFNNIFVNFMGMKKGLFILCALIAVIVVFSCKKKKEAEKPDLGEAYYPPTIGKYVIYDVDSTVYDEFTFKGKNSKYQIKEKITEEYTDSQGRPALKLIRYIKKFDSIIPYSAMPWTIKDVWQVNITNKNVEIVEENIRFVKLIFPVKESSTWDGNSTNTMGQWDYTYAYVDNKESINGNSFDKVTQVTQKNFPTLISREYYIEKYAKDVGLVYREIIDIDFQDTVVPLSFPLNNVLQKHGVVYKSKVISYGVE